MARLLRHNPGGVWGRQPSQRGEFFRLVNTIGLALIPGASSVPYTSSRLLALLNLSTAPTGMVSCAWLFTPRPSRTYGSSGASGRVRLVGVLALPSQPASPSPLIELPLTVLRLTCMLGVPPKSKFR